MVRVLGPGTDVEKWPAHPAGQHFAPRRRPPPSLADQRGSQRPASAMDGLGAPLLRLAVPWPASVPCRSFWWARPRLAGAPFSWYRYAIGENYPITTR